MEASAQFGPPPGPPPASRLIAPEDITGNWVSVVTEDYRWRVLACSCATERRFYQRAVEPFRYGVG
jgi:hypothetical protein